MDIGVKDIRIINEYKPICNTQYGLLVYKKEKLYIMDYDTEEVRFLADIKLTDKRRKYCVNRLLTRLMHLSVYCGIEVDGGAIVAVNKGIYFIDITNKKITREHSFRKNGMRRPLGFSYLGELDGFHPIVYGEYFSNDNREDVCIWGRNIHGEWEQLYKFRSGEIRHVHCIVPDVYNQRALIATGDLDSECAIWESRDNFKTLNKMIGGNQAYRTSCISAYKNGFVYATDSPYDDNHIYYYSYKKSEIKAVKEILGPVVFFTRYKDYLIFATNVENDGRNMSKIRQLFSYKRGFGVKDWYVHIYIGSLSEGFKEICRIKKDLLPMYPFGFGNIHFPSGECKDTVYFYPTAVNQGNEKMWRISFKNSVQE